jgi:hypothetical protein
MKTLRDEDMAVLSGYNKHGSLLLDLTRPVIPC